MEQETLSISNRSSKQTGLGHLVLSVRDVGRESSTLVVGRPGMPNVTRDLSIGDAILFETPDEGILEVRALEMTATLSILVTRVSPRLGLRAGLGNIDPNNLPFTQAELTQIASSFEGMKQEARQQLRVDAERMDLLLRKFDEMSEASCRLGRKDWTNYVVGALTNIMTALALDHETGRQLLVLVSGALSWLFNQSLNLLQ